MDKRKKVRKIVVVYLMFSICIIIVKTEMLKTESDVLQGLKNYFRRIPKSYEIAIP